MVEEKLGSATSKQINVSNFFYKRSHSLEKLYIPSLFCNLWRDRHRAAYLHGGARVAGRVFCDRVRPSCEPTDHRVKYLRVLM